LKQKLEQKTKKKAAIESEAKNQAMLKQKLEQKIKDRDDLAQQVKTAYDVI